MTQPGADNVALPAHPHRRIHLREDPWLTALLPVRCVNVDVQCVAGDPPLTAEEFIAFTPDSGFATLRLPVTGTADLPALLRLGWRVATITLTWRWYPDVGVGHLPPPAPGRYEVGGAPTATVRAATVGDLPAVRALAEEAFTDSRYLADPHFPRPWARLIKGEWATNLATGRRGQGCLIAERNAAAAAFLGYLQSDGNTVIDLIATKPEDRGHGLASALITTLQRQLTADHDGAALTVGTQATNTPSIALYQRCGFHLAPGTHFVLHWGP